MAPKSMLPKNAYYPSYGDFFNIEFHSFLWDPMCITYIVVNIYIFPAALQTNMQTKVLGK